MISDKEFKNQHKVAMMILERSWMKKSKSKPKYEHIPNINSPLRKEIVFYNQHMRYKFKYHLFLF